MKKLGLFFVTLFIGCAIGNSTAMAEEPCHATNVSELRRYLGESRCSVVTIPPALGATTSDIFEIKRSVSIEGESGETKFIGQFKITGTTAETEVSIKNISISFRIGAEHDNYTNVLVESPVKLTIDNMNVSNASSTLSELKYRTIDFSASNEGSNVDGSTLTINNSSIFGFYEGVRVGGSNVTVNINNSHISGRYGLALGNEGKTFNDNVVNISGSKLYGISKNEADAALLISGQNNLKVNIGKSSSGESLLSNDIYDSTAGPSLADIIRFFSSSDNGGVDSSNVNININDSTEINDRSSGGTTHLFHFGVNTTNTITIGKDVKLINNSGGNIDRKYNTNSLYYVVGVYDELGNATVKTYSNGSVNEDVQTELNKVENSIKAMSNPKYRLKGWFTDKDTTMSKAESITANVDLYPKKVKLYEVTIEDNTYVVEEGNTLGDIDSDSENESKPKISDIEGRDNFSRFVEENTDTTVNNETQINKDMKLEVKETAKVTVKANGTQNEYKVEKGKNLNSLQNIEELKDFVKGVNKQFTDKFRDDGGSEYNFDSEITSDITLNAIYNVTVTINDHEYTLEENKNLNDLAREQEDAKSDIDSLKNVNNKKFASFNIGETDPITENTSITPSYNVVIKVYKADGTFEEIEFAEGNKLSEYVDSEGKIAGAKTKADREFSRWVTKENGEEQTFSEDENINENTSIYPKFNIKVTISGVSYNLEEEKNLNDLMNEKPDAKTAIEALKEFAGKHFGRFVNEAKPQDTIEEVTPLNENLTIKAIYVVKVKIVGAKITKDIILDENQSLNDYNWSNKDTFDGLKEKDNRTFSRFVDGSDTFDENTSISEDKNLTAKYNVNVKINGHDYTLEEGKTLNDLEEPAKTDLESLKNAKANFSRLTDKSGNTVTESEAINDNIELFAKFNVKVTISGEVYDLEEGKTLNDLSEPAKTKLNELKNVSDKHFGRFVNEAKPQDTIEETTAINEDLTIKAIYVVNVKIVGAKVTKEIVLDENQNLNDYNWSNRETFDGLKEKDNRTFSRFVEDDNTFDEMSSISEDKTLTAKYNVNVKINGHDYTLEEGRTLKELSSEALEKLKLLKQPTEKFSRLIDTYGNTVTEEEAINDNIELFAKFNVKVTISGVSYDLEEGKTLNELNDTAKEELSRLKSVSDKTFKNFISDKNEVIDEEKTNITSDIIITPKYTVTLKINGKDYVIDEGQSLKDIGNEVIEELKNPSNKTFKMFTLQNGEEITLETVFDHHATINVIYNITVTLINENGDVKTYILLEGDDLSATNEDAKELLNSIVDKNKLFVRFINQNGETVEYNTKFYENTVIKALYKIKVTIDDEEFILEEGQSLDDLTKEDKERLEALITPEEGKVFVGFINDNEIIGTNVAFTKDTTLKTVFEDKTVENETTNNNDNTNNSTNNPQTGDHIKNYIAIAIMAIASIGISIKTVVKNIISKKN